MSVFKYNYPKLSFMSSFNRIQWNSTKLGREVHRWEEGRLKKQHAWDCSWVPVQLNSECAVCSMGLWWNRELDPAAQSESCRRARSTYLAFWEFSQAFLVFILTGILCVHINPESSDFTGLNAGNAETRLTLWFLSLTQSRNSILADFYDVKFLVEGIDLAPYSNLHVTFMCKSAGE